jgi:bacterioferritin-associated ferredoxin
MSDRKEKVRIPAVPAHEKEVVVGQNCDRCGKDIPKMTNYRRRDFTLEFFEGTSYPESVNLEGWELPDCCDDCVAFMRELLEKNGFKIVIADRYYY